MVEFELNFQYAQAQEPALRKAGGSIPAGRCVVLCGGSGCGKSTLLRCLNGLIPQFYEGALTGFCRLNGQDTAGLSIGETGELAASVFQDPRSQFFTVNSSNEVAFGLENHGLPQEEIKKRVDEAFRVFHLERLKDRSVYKLSSGERQLISILSEWAMDTDIFLLDEPTAGQDAESLERCAALIRDMRKEKTVLIITHDLELIAAACDRCLGLSDGRAEAEFPVQSEQDLQAIRAYMERFQPAGIQPKKQHKELLHPAAKLLYWLVLAAAIAAGLIL